MFKLRDLPFERTAFNGKFISERTIDFHYAKHHQAYINNLNNLIKDTEFENKSLYDIVMNAKGGIYNNAAQVYNHDFYFDCITPKSTKPSSALESAINRDFSSLEGFRKAFIDSATALFGSGWCFATLNHDKKLEIVPTSNANTPLESSKIPILVVDVWEHAYYIDYQNLRAKYLEEFYKYINWEFVSSAYEWALKESLGSVRFYMNDVHKEQS